MFKLFRLIKDTFAMFFFVSFIITALILYSLFNEESFKKDCKDLGLKCEQSELIDSTTKAKSIFQNVLQKIKSIDW